MRADNPDGSARKYKKPSPALLKLLKGGPRAPELKGLPPGLQQPLTKGAVGGAPGEYTVGARNTEDVAAPKREYKPLKTATRQLKKKPVVETPALGRRVPGESRQRPSGGVTPTIWLRGR